MHPHKCGGNTINRIFSPYSDVKLITRDSYSGKNQGSIIPVLPNCKHTTYEAYVKAFPEIQNYFKFSVFRNPYDRVASWYSHKNQKNKPNTFEEAEKFVRSIRTDGPNRIPSQVKYYGLDGENFLDYIIDFNNFEKDLRIVYQTVTGNELKEVSIINKSPMKNPEDFYTYGERSSQELKEFVYEIFFDDFEFMKEFIKKGK